MEGFAGVIVVIFVAYFVYDLAYKRGKREGSKKGYGVGFDRGKKSTSGGCLVILLSFGVILFTGTIVIACRL